MRFGKRAAVNLIDRGVVPGTSPLDTHVVMCGLPRTGSTLLQLICESRVGDLPAVQARLGEFIGWPVPHPFVQYLEHARPRDGMTEGTLGGLRPLDKSRLKPGRVGARGAAGGGAAGLGWS